MRSPRVSAQVLSTKNRAPGVLRTVAIRSLSLKLAQVIDRRLPASGLP